MPSSIQYEQMKELMKRVKRIPHVVLLVFNLLIRIEFTISNIFAMYNEQISFNNRKLDNFNCVTFK